MANDGVIVPWNFQNSMAEVSLGLYIETGEQKYLNRCNELILTFTDEWIEESDRIYWHYWPKQYYDGWESDGRSINTPLMKRTVDTLFEDASHAGITIRLLNRHIKYIQCGVINEQQISKIESNMNYFCFEDGFSRFISGDAEYVPISWHYWISPYYAYLHNDKFEKYVRQGYLKCFPEWDSQESLFANSRLYDPSIEESRIIIKRKIIDENGQDIVIESVSLSRDDLSNFIFENY